jgi:hypothetical protein
VNWRLKIFAKIVLHHLPINYKFWQKIGLFRLGSMEQYEYAEKIFLLHTNRAFPDLIPVNSTFLELGPGDSLSSAILANASGIKKIYLVDVGNYINDDMSIYRKLTDKIRKKNKNCIDANTIESVEALLQACNAIYLTNGLDSLKEIPDSNIDFVWSHSVLEHIRKRDFENTFIELKRIIKSGGLMSHNVDFMDHLGGALNNLRFNEKIWESNFFSDSGFYTNRIRYSEIEALFNELGFNIIESNYSSWEKLPTPKKKMGLTFQNFSETDLKIQCGHFLVKKYEIS